MNKLLPLLAIETSGELCSVAVFKEGNKFNEVNLKLKNVHSQMLVPMIEQALNNINLSPEEIKTVAVSIGPGSFTGLRIGLATAKGFAIGAGAKICPVGVFDSIAFKISRFLPAGEEFRIVLHANTTDVYTARFKVDEESYAVMETPAIVNKEELKKIISNSLLVFGDSFTGIKSRALSLPNALAVGEWALKFGVDLTTDDFDFLEPEYFHQFIPKVKK
jgi:tRNA threonylcarbamoyladenosine biosynthesis protein TsaB